MKAEQSGPDWLTEDLQLSFEQLAQYSGLPSVQLRELVELGVVEPLDSASSPWVFSGTCLLTIRAARRVQSGFELDPHAMALVVALLDRISALETQVRRLRAQVPRFHEPE